MSHDPDSDSDDWFDRIDPDYLSGRDKIEYVLMKAGVSEKSGALYLVPDRALEAAHERREERGLTEHRASGGVFNSIVTRRPTPECEHAAEFVPATEYDGGDAL